jgi:hypothetical protein
VSRWQQSGWKVPSDDFGRKSGGGLWYWVQQGIQHPSLAAYRDFQLGVVIPNWTFDVHLSRDRESLPVRR